MKGSPEISLGDLTPTRDLLYVKDTANGFVEIAKSDSLIGEDCNIATQSEISIGDLAGKLISIINPAAMILQANERIRPAKSEVFRLYGSKEKITNHTGWKQQYNLDEGLKETIDWFSKEEDLRGYKTSIYNI